MLQHERHVCLFLNPQLDISTSIAQPLGDLDSMIGRDISIIFTIPQSQRQILSDILHLNMRLI